MKPSTVGHVVMLLLSSVLVVTMSNGVFDLREASCANR